MPESFGDTVHLDILYGSATAHGNVKYGLYPIDRATIYKAIYPISDLSADIIPQLKKFCNEMNTTPKHFISDCDSRLFSKDIQDWLDSNNSRITCAPEGKQRQNGLAEGTWKTVLRMARSWVSSALLPPTF